MPSLNANGYKKDEMKSPHFLMKAMKIFNMYSQTCKFKYTFQIFKLFSYCVFKYCSKNILTEFKISRVLITY